MTRNFIAYIEFDPDTRLYTGFIPGLAGAHSQGATVDELRDNLREVVELVMEERRAHGDPVEVGEFVGIQQIAVNE
jgi:predicted RNase H-like HicB family nuclease